MTRRPRWLRRSGAVAGVSVTAVCSLLLQPGTAVAAQSLSVGRTFNDGLTTTLGAQRMASAMSSVGYTSHSFTNGTTAANVFTETQAANVFFMFMHANAGFMTTDEDQYLIADDKGQLGALTGTPVGDDRFRKLTSYLEFVDIDDIKVMFFAGCDTAQTSADFGRLATVAKQKGVDAAVSYLGLVYGADKSAANKDYSGNYYWGRAAYYLQTGNTVYNALDKARADLVAKEGNAGGWDDFLISGAVASPAAVRVTPAGPGHEYDSMPVDLGPITSDLTVTDTRSEVIDGRQVIDQTTAQGYTIRRSAATGDVVGVFGTPTTTGTTSMDDQAALDRATAFLTENVAAFGPQYALTRSAHASHLEGDALSAFQWRPLVHGVPGPARIDVEVDRHTGAITYLAVSKRAASSTEAPTLTADDAVRVARSVVGPAGTATAVVDIWDTPQWTVTVDRGVSAHGWRDAVQIVVDARSGQVLARRDT